MRLRVNRLPLRRTLAASLGTLALVATAVLPGAASAASPTNWKLDAGAASNDQAIQVNAFLPREISINVGDTITWTNPAGEFHTVSFLSGGARPDLIIVGPGGPDINPSSPCRRVVRAIRARLLQLGPDVSRRHVHTWLRRRRQLPVRVPCPQRDERRGPRPAHRDAIPQEPDARER